MLWTPSAQFDFNFSVDNFGATYTEAALGTSVPAAGSTNTKGTNTALLAGVAQDIYGIAIGFAGESVASATRRHLTDLLIDPAAGIGNAGSSWSVAIANLYSWDASIGRGAGVAGLPGCWYYFPMYFSAGTAIGAVSQSNTASAALRVLVRAWGKPTYPHLVRVGTRVQTLGAVTGTTSGTSVTIGSSGTMGSYSASLGTTNFDAWWWQVGFGATETAVTQTQSMLVDIAANATNKVTLNKYRHFQAGGIEERYGCTPIASTMLPIYDLASGQDIYVRGVAQGTASAGGTTVVYALGS